MMDWIPERMPWDGKFPFGAENGPRPVREAASGFSRQLIIGTYPSALHVGWRPPAYVDVPRGANGRIASLAVDVEPTVFWDGSDADDRIHEWMSRVGFVMGDYPGAHGHLTKAMNGPTGVGLVDHYFPALPYGLSETAFIDVYPVYFVKKGTASRRGQADAIAQDYDSVVSQLSGAADFHPRFEMASLPLRPPKTVLPAMAADRFAHWVGGVILDLKPDHIVTLGEEVWETLDRSGMIHRASAPSLAHTRRDGYGRVGTLRLGSATIQWTALAHPGAVRQSAKAHDSWAAVHRRWLTDNARG